MKDYRGYNMLHITTLLRLVIRFLGVAWENLIHIKTSLLILVGQHILEGGHSAIGIDMFAQNTFSFLFATQWICVVSIWSIENDSIEEPKKPHPNTLIFFLLYIGTRFDHISQEKETCQFNDGWRGVHVEKECHVESPSQCAHGKVSLDILLSNYSYTNITSTMSCREFVPMCTWQGFIGHPFEQLFLYQYNLNYVMSLVTDDEEPMKRLWSHYLGVRIALWWREWVYKQWLWRNLAVGRLKLLRERGDILLDAWIIYVKCFTNVLS